MMTSLTKSQKRLLILLALVLGYAVFDVTKNRAEYFSFYFGEDNKAQSYTKQNRVVRTAQKSSSTDKAEFLQSWGRDPFHDAGLVSSVSVRPRQASPLILRAISYDGGNSVVMINNKILGLGDRIEGYRVIGIEPHQVVLRKGNETKTLILK